MKIKKITNIKNVGVFKEYLNNNLEFKNINYIYANNACGKSTLVDVLKDISDNSNSRLKCRKTIPSNGNQFVKVVIQEDMNNSSEKNLMYTGDRWQNNKLEGNILFFDTDFIEKNVFNGMELLNNKDTKSNFSGFILGDAGVNLMHERNIINNELYNERKLMRESVPKSMKDEDKTENQIKEYCNNNYCDEEDKLRLLKDKLEKEIKVEKDLLDNKEKSSEFKGIRYINLDSMIAFKMIIEDVKNILEQSYKIKVEDWEEYREHIKLIHWDENARNSWIEKGLEYSRDSDNCPFCGLDLKHSTLLKIYKNIFSGEYLLYSENIRKHVKEIIDIINSLELSFNKSDILLDYERSITIFGDSLKYKDNFFYKLERFNNWIDENSLKIKKEKEKIKAALESKAIFPKDILSYNFKEIKDIIGCAEVICEELNTEIKVVNKDILDLKAKIEKQDKTTLDKLEEELENLDHKINRIEEDESCNKWLNHYNKVETLLKEREEKDLELKDSQEKYLDEYFDDINNYFKKFGGYNYKLERGATNRRYKEPVIGVNIYFKDVDVSGIESSRLFSESDRRALALSIFMAKINNLSSETLKEMIVVFDDPVTSFDTDRMTPISRILLKLIEKVNQLFIFSHQYDFSKKMFDNFRGKNYSEDKGSIEYYQIIKSSKDVSRIDTLDANKFFNHEFLKQYDEIKDFIIGEKEFLKPNDLRIFIEDYLTISFPRLYCEEFSKKNVPLEEKINVLTSQGYLSEEVGKEIRVYKDTLNPASHQYSHFTSQELRTYSREVLEYLDNQFRLS